MIHIHMRCKTKKVTLLSFLMVFLLFVTAQPAWGHGGKTHGGAELSSLQVAEKATKLYTQLITKGKLPETWETGLTSIEINTKTLSGIKEYVVQFKRNSGKQRSVYFFFDQEGKYIGSNFTGK